MNTSDSSSTTSRWLTEAVRLLESSDVPTARLDCLVLLEDTTHKDRSWLLAHPEHLLSAEQLETLDASIARRCKHEPLAYIRGKSEFYGRKFTVNPHTLEPRPETETMIDLLKQVVEGGRWKVEGVEAVVDIGTGSGCIAITAKLELPDIEMYAIDIDKACIKTAEKNAKKMGADIKFHIGDLLEALPSSAFHLPHSGFAILANLPYVPDSYKLNEAARHEPAQAIFGGSDGLDLYRRLFFQIDSAASKPLFILTESLPFQHETLASIASSHGYQLAETDDFIQLFVPVSD